MDKIIRKHNLSENLKLVKSKISSAKTDDERISLLNEVNKLQAELNTLESGMVIEISETKPGRFRIMRDYTIDSAANKKLKRLSV